MIPHEIPDRPWLKVGADIFQLGSQDYLCLVDYFSKFPVIRHLKTKTAHSVIDNLRSVFAEYGIPQEVVSDNMPFASHEFRTFAESYRFTTTTSSPTYSQSNGQVERMIGTVKKIIKKARDPYLALLEYRNTPFKGLKYSPAQMINNRRLRSKLPVSTEALKPEVPNDAHTQLLHLQNRSKDRYDKGSRNLSPLATGAPVWARVNNTWKPARVKAKHNAPRSYTLESERGQLFRRNRRQLQPRNASDNAFVFMEPPIDPEPDEAVTTNRSSPVQAPPSHDRPATRSGRVPKAPKRLDL